MTKPIDTNTPSSSTFTNPNRNATPSHLDETNKIYHKMTHFNPYGITRCQFLECHKKIPFAMHSLVCKCEKTFCQNHRLPEDHKCSFGWKQYSREQLTKHPKKESLQNFSSQGARGNHAY